MKDLKGLTVHEAQVMLHKLNNDMLELVKAFERDTDMIVTEIYAHRVPLPFGFSKITHIECNADITTLGYGK